MQRLSRSFNLSLPWSNSRRREGTQDHHRVLNYDIWYTIASYLTIKDVRSLTLVCKECRAATLPRLLSSVDPADESKLKKMCSHLSKSTYFSAAHLQGLRIGWQPLSPPYFAARWVGCRFHRKSTIPHALATLLSQAVNLRSLSLHRIEDLIKAEPRVGEALIALKHLNTLELLDIGRRTWKVVARVESRPTSLSLGYDSRASSRRDLIHLTRIPFLERVRKLRLHRFQFENAPMNTDLPGIRSLRPWPAVEELYLSYSLYLPFYRFCPNLRILSLWWTWMTSGTDMDMVAWPSAVPLRRATMDQLDAQFILGIPVHFLNLRSLYMNADLTLQVLRESSPIALSLWCSNAKGLEADLWERLVAAANAPQARLRYLMTTLYVQPNDGLCWLRDIVPLLSQSRLICFRIIVVNIHCSDDVLEEPHCDIASLPSEWKVFFRVAQRTLARAIPSLRFFSMLYVPMLTPNRNSIHYLRRDYDMENFTWWRVVAPDGNPASKLFENLPMETGEMIHQYLLSDEFGRTLCFNEDQFLPCARSV